MISAIQEILSFLTLVGTVLVLLFVLVIFFIFFLKSKTPCFIKTISKIIAENVIAFSLVIALVATFGSLFYSEIAGYEPCKLCWYQRILMYPQALILWLALVLKTRDALKYSLLLSLLGAPLAGYHYLLQRGVVEVVPCSTVGYSVSCAEKFFMSYGYITIPMMAFTAFVLILCLGLIAKLSSTFSKS